MNKRILQESNFIKRISIKKIFKYFFIILAVLLLSFILWWEFIFLPDDFKISEKEALQESAHSSFKTRSYDLIKNIAGAELGGDFSNERISKAVEDLKSGGLLIKGESLAYGKNSNLIQRAGTGHVGIWVDERSSIILLPGTSVSFSVTLSDNDEIGFSALSGASDGLLTVKAGNGNSTVLLEDYKLDKYTQPYKSSDVKLKLNNRGWDKAATGTGWIDKRITVKNNSSNKKQKLTFSVPSGSGPVFISNPNIYTESKRKKYNVVYIIFDGVAQRYWSFHNEKSALTPRMKESAEKDFIVFDNMYAIGNKTRVALSGLFTSKISTETRHGINRNFIPAEEREIFYKYINQGKIASLPDYFRKNGYVSAQFGNSGFTVELLSSGLDYGFEKSYEFQTNPYNTYGISNKFFNFLRDNRDKNFFVYCHYNTPHKPFYAPLKYYFKGLINSPLAGLWRPDFTGCISYTDDAYKNIYAALQKNGLLENSIIVIATDHGSGYELSTFDGGFHYNDYTKQVFMIHIPESLKKELNISGGRRETYISSINIAPTLVQLANIEVPSQFSGKSFVPVLKNEYKKDMWDDRIWTLGRKDISMITPDLKKYILTGVDSDKFVKRDYVVFGDEYEKPFELLYDLKTDPHEYNNIVKTDRVTLAGMRKIFFESDIHHPEKTVLTFSPDKTKQSLITVTVNSSSRLLRAEIYNDKIKLVKEYPVTGNSKSFSFNLNKEPVYFIFEQEDDRIPVSIDIQSDGKRIKKTSIYATQLDLNLLDNPVKLASVLDFRMLYTDKLPLQKNWKGNNGDGVSVKVSRIDLHRWIDINKAGNQGLSASMKETLKSWGYIQ
ncbi:MAG TPA: sulfatase-like hydrolase/transferase [Spirochaetota bacterium]|nr:sulfatase-like hydrolase/transferase [Spirochaetota bacterium]